MNLERNLNDGVTRRTKRLPKGLKSPAVKDKPYRTSRLIIRFPMFGVNENVPKRL